MGIKAWISGKVQRHPFLLFVAALSSILFLTEGIKKIRYAEQLLQEIVNAGVITTIKTGNVVELQLRSWFAYVLFLMVIVLLLMTALYLRSHLNLKELRDSKLKHTALVEKTLEGMMAASLRIRNQLIKVADDDPILRLSSVEVIYVIRKNGDVEITRRDHLWAAKSTVHFWEYPFTADDLAAEAPFLDNLNFKICDHSGSSVVYLPMKNEVRSKIVNIYFLPEIRTDEAAPRILEIKYTWPGFANTLLSKKRDHYSCQIKSHQPVPEMKMKFLYEELGGQIRAHHVGFSGGEQTLQHLGKSEANLNILEYAIRNAPSANYIVELQLKMNAK
jgi:hypothetical protein